MQGRVASNRWHLKGSAVSDERGDMVLELKTTVLNNRGTTSQRRSRPQSHARGAVSLTGKAIRDKRKPCLVQRLKRKSMALEKELAHDVEDDDMEAANKNLTEMIDVNM